MEIKKTLKSGIYKILNLINGKKYIGSSFNIKNRFRQHKHRLLNNKHENPYLQNAWIKYGQQSFAFEIVELCEKENLQIREQYWIDYEKVTDRNKGYNLRKDAYNKEFSEEHRKNISDGLKKYYSINSSALIGVPRSNEIKRKISLANTGRVASIETKKRIGEANKRRGLDFWKRMSEAHIGNTHTEESKNKIRKSSNLMWKNKKERDPIKYKCIICGKEKETYSLIKKLKYCSNKCCKKDIRSKNAKS